MANQKGNGLSFSYNDNGDKQQTSVPDNIEQPPSCRYAKRACDGYTSCTDVSSFDSRIYYYEEYTPSELRSIVEEINGATNVNNRLTIPYSSFMNIPIFQGVPSPKKNLRDKKSSERKKGNTKNARGRLKSVTESYDIAGSQSSVLGAPSSNSTDELCNRSPYLYLPPGYSSFRNDPGHQLLHFGHQHQNYERENFFPNPSIQSLNSSMTSNNDSANSSISSTSSAFSGMHISGNFYRNVPFSGISSSDGATRLSIPSTSSAFSGLQSGKTMNKASREKMGKKNRSVSRDLNKYEISGRVKFFSTSTLTSPSTSNSCQEGSIRRTSRNCKPSTSKDVHLNNVDPKSSTISLQDSTANDDNKDPCAPAMFSSDEEDMESEDSSITYEGIPVGMPIKYTDRLDPTPDEFLPVGRNETRSAISKYHIICKSCVETSNEKNVSSLAAKGQTSFPPDINGKYSAACNTGTKDKGKGPMKGKGKGKAKNRPHMPEEQPAVPEQENGAHVNTDLPAGHSCDNCVPKCVAIERVDEQDGASHTCFGCQKPVHDRYILYVKDHGYWHADCLKCSNCQDNLSSQKTCYVKNEQIYCRDDYQILFGWSCVKCSLQFKKEQDWMRVAGQHRYHIACFLCKICKRQLGNNEKYHLVNGTDIYCTNHYRDMVTGENSDGQQPPKKAKRNRTSYTEAQIKFLQERFLRDSNPDGNELEKIAAHINLKKRVVQVWFQNNRARLKKSANNNKGGNNENKNPSTSNGVSGPGTLHDAMSMDWDNSMEQSSLDEQNYTNPSSPQMRPGSDHFLDPTPFALTSALNGPINAPLLCLPTGSNSSAAMGQGPSPLGGGSGSGASNCGTPHDQVSPHYPELGHSSYQGTDGHGVTTVGGADGGVDDLAGAAGNFDHDNNNGSNNGTGGMSKNSSNNSPLFSALRSSIMGDKYTEDGPKPSGSRDQHELHRLMLLQEHHPSHHPHHHHQQSHHHSFHGIDSPYPSHFGVYGNLYNMYGTYGSLHPLAGDTGQGFSSMPESLMRHRSEQNNHIHTNGDSSVQPPFHGDGGNMFSGAHLDLSSGPSSARPPFGNNMSSNAGAGSSNTAILGFLGASGSSHQTQQGRPSPDPCGYSQGHGSASPQPFGRGHQYGHASGGSPTTQGRQNGGGGQFQFMPLNRQNYLPDGDSA